MKINRRIRKINMKKVALWVHVLVFVVVVALVVWGLTTNPITSDADEKDYETLHTGWSQEVNGELVELSDIRDFIHVDEGEKLVFKRTLPPLENGKAILMYTKNQEVTCEVGGEVVQNFHIPKNLAVLQTPGRAWNQIDLGECMSSQEMTLTLYSPISYYTNAVGDVYFVDGIDVNNVRLRHLYFRVFFAFGMFVLMVVSFGNSFVWKKQSRRRYFLALGQFYFCFLNFELARLNFYDIFTGRPVLSYLIEQIFIRLIPLATWFLVKNSTKRYRFPWLIRMVTIFTVANFFVPWVLLFGFGVTLFDSLWINILMMMGITLGCFIVVVLRITRIKTLEPEEYPGLVLGLLFLGGVVDMILMFTRTEETIFVGIGSAVSCLLYTFVTYSIFAKQDSNTDIEKQKIEHSYFVLQNTTLVQQIKAHFIFNTLNTISALCKEDAMVADEAINKFAWYLRAYLKYVNTQENIPVQKELDMVRNYLAIEKFRFEDRLTFEFDIQFRKFVIPPISIQTFVENAVVHGIKKKVEGGHILVATRKEGDFAKVIISDTGAGFDVSATPKEASVGVQNVKHRMAIMANGTVHIESEVGKGTRVEITVPLK